MNKFKKTCIAAVSVFLCLCLTAASVIWIKRDRNNPPAKTQGNNVSDTEGVSSDMTESTKETETESVTETESETTTESTTAEPSTKPSTTAKPTTTKPVTTKPTTTKPATTTKPYKPAEGYTLSHEIAGSVPKNTAVTGSWFDDAVFVGDSVSLKLSYYEASVDRLGKAQFLVAGSLSSTNALWDVNRSNAVHPKYKGKKQKVEDSISQMSVKKVYIMLGMNDINAVGINGSVKNFEKLCNNILEKSPNVQIYVQSVTPMASSSNVASSKEGRLNNKSIYEYNTKLAQLAQNRGWYFINVSEVMFDDNGYLKNEYCSDLNSMGIHFTNAGCTAWIDYLLTHTP